MSFGSQYVAGKDDERFVFGCSNVVGNYFKVFSHECMFNVNVLYDDNVIKLSCSITLPIPPISNDV